MAHLSKFDEEFGSVLRLKEEGIVEMKTKMKTDWTTNWMSLTNRRNGARVNCVQDSKRHRHIDTPKEVRTCIDRITNICKHIQSPHHTHTHTHTHTHIYIYIHTCTYIYTQAHKYIYIYTYIYIYIYIYIYTRRCNLVHSHVLQALASKWLPNQ